MELRSGHTLKFVLENREKNKVLDRIESDNKMSTNNITVVNTRSAITPFHGRIDGILGQSVVFDRKFRSPISIE